LTLHPSLNTHPAPPRPTLFPYTTLFRSQWFNRAILKNTAESAISPNIGALTEAEYQELLDMAYRQGTLAESEKEIILQIISLDRSEEHTSELQSRENLVCRLLLEKKKEI